MGGLGSGSWYRYGSKSTTEASKRIDIRYLRKNGWLVPGYVGSLSWSTNGESLGSIGYRIHSDVLELDYRFKSHNADEWKPVNKCIWFEKTHCNYGGERWWFQCPDCGRRCEVLYMYGSGFTCRKCADLAYYSQQEQPIDRNYRQARKIRRKLVSEIDPDFEVDNLDYPVLFKPKGMHQKTFDRLRHKHEKYIDNAMGYLTLYLNKITGLI